MAGFSLPGQVPYAAVGGPSDFAVASNAALRKRKMAEMLQAQAFKPNEVGLIPGSKMSLVNPLAALLNSYVGNKLETDADTEEAAANKAAQEGMAAHLDAMPQSTPGVESQPIEQEQVGAPPGAAPPPAAPSPFGPQAGGASPLAALLAGGAPPQADPLAPPAPQGPAGPPLLPQKMDMAAPGMLPKMSTDAVPGKDVTAADLYKWGAGFNQFGKAGERMAEQVTGGAMKAMMPMSPTDMAEMQAKQEMKKADLQQRADAAKLRSEDARLSIEQRATASRQHDALMRELAAGRRDAAAAAREAGGGGGHTVGMASDGSGRVIENKNGDRTLIKADGTRVPNFTGDTTPIAAAEKAIQDTTAARGHLASVSSLMDDVTKNPGAYGTVAAFGAGIPVIGKYIADSQLSPEQRETRAGVTSQMSELTKRIFGSAFTTSEQGRATPYIVEPGDPFDVAVSKLKKMQSLAQEALDRKSTVGVAGSNARAPNLPSAGGAAPAAAPSATWGKVEKH